MGNWGGLIEYTIPDKPNSRPQKYRLTSKGQALLASLHYRKLVPKEDGKAIFEISPS